MKDIIKKCKDEIAQKHGYRILVNTKGWDRWDKMYDENPSQRTEFLLELIKRLESERIEIATRIEDTDKKN